MRVIYLVVALCAAGGPAAAQAVTGHVTGTVRTDAGAPMADVAVRLVAVTDGTTYGSRTGSDGRFMIGAPEGTYALSVDALGYRGGDREVELLSGQTTEVELRLTAAPMALDQVVVTAARMSAPAAALPVAVRVVTSEKVAQQVGVSTGLNGLLSNVVPGLAAPTGSASVFGQTFRGRKLAVLIDGVPQSTGRNVMRDLETIDPSAIERVEVLSGATAIYGDGATGGVINLITRKATPGMRLTTGVGVESAPAAMGSSAGMHLTQGVSGQSGAVDYVGRGSWSTGGSFFDGEGDRIPADPQGQGGLADYRSLGLLGKVGVTFGERRAELSVNRFSGMQHTEYTTDPAVNAADPGEAKARAIDGLDLSEHIGTENLNVAASYRDGAVLGGELRGQVFARDYLTRFAPFDGRSYLNHVAQSFVDSRKFGGRAELEREVGLLRDGTAVVGVDYTHEVSYQGLNLMDPDVFDESGGRSFRKIGEAKWVPEIATAGVAMFTQLGWSPVERLSLRGGLRHERVRMHVDDFTTVVGNQVQGGNLHFAPVLLNVGAVVSATRAVDLFGSYAQGFSIADIGRVLRGAPAGFELGSHELKAQLVDHYEAGARGHWSGVQASGSVFYSYSALGTTLNADLQVVRAPERIRGLEVALDAQPSETVALGGTLTWSEGESEDPATGEWKALDGFRIQPMKVTAHAEHRWNRQWTNRLQLLHSGSRDRAFEDGLTYGHLPVSSYTVLDWTSRVHVGPGRVDIGVHNLLDAQYFPVVSQLYAQWGNSYRAAARGRTVSIGYTVTY